MPNESPRPSTYLFNKLDQQFILYLGEYSTSQGLSLFPNDTKVKLSNLAVDSASSIEPIKEATTVEQMVAAIEEFGPSLIDIDIQIEGFGSLSTHDDGECHFQSTDKDRCLELVKQTIGAPNPAIAEKLVTRLSNKFGTYISVTKTNSIVEYRDFDDFIRRTQ